MDKTTPVDNEKGKSGFYETFDSGSGPNIPDSAEKDFAHNDSGGNLTDSDDHGKVPTMPQK